MKQAELIITIGGWSHQSTIHTVGFDSVENAFAEFERIATLLKRRGDKENDIPKFLDIEGISKFTCNFDQICAVGLLDLKREDSALIGIKDAYPHLNWK